MSTTPTRDRDLDWSTDWNTPTPCCDEATPERAADLDWLFGHDCPGARDARRCRDAYYAADSIVMGAELADAPGTPPSRGTGARRGGPGYGAPSDRQADYIRALIADGKTLGLFADTDADEVIKSLDRDGASTFIDVTKAALSRARAIRGAQDTTGCRPNKYAGMCRHCHTEVRAGAGDLCKVAGKWLVAHRDGECQPEAAAPATSAPTSTPGDPGDPGADVVPEGYYALPSTGDNDIVFYRVDRPTEGKWAGRVFVKMVVGGRADTRVRRDAVAGVLARIAEAGAREAMAAFGREIGRCGRCFRHLTDEESRRSGLGPHCRNL